MHGDEAKIPEIDFAIVGAGVAGTYVAWRLANAPLKSFQGLVPQPSSPLTVGLFEATRRVGGRLLTVPMPGMPSGVVELGGMRYTGSHLLLANLVHKKLKLPSKLFAFNTPLMYLRGRHFDPYGAPPYELDADEKGRTPDELVKHGIRCALKEADFQQEDAKQEEIKQVRERLRILHDDNEELNISVLTPKQWRLLKRHAFLHGSKLYDIGFWNLLQYYLSSEGFLFAHDGLGYESVFANWNAAEAIPWFLKDFGIDYLTVQTGMETVPARLGFEFLYNSAPCQGSIHLGHELTSVKRFDDRNGGLLELVFMVDKKEPKTWRAKHVILAIPKKPLKRIRRLADLDRTGTGHWSDLRESVTAHPLFKLFLGYRCAWWKDSRALACASGRAVTDLPIRQVYYFGPDQPTTSRAMLMASYSDAHYVDFWKPLRRHTLEKPYHEFDEGEEPLNDKEREALWLFGAAENMVRKAHRQVKQLHPQLRPEGIPKPYVALAMDWWNSSHLGYDYGGWHSWAVHRKPWEDMIKLVKPFDANLYICGEAYSCEQGWVEGALRSAEMALKKLGLAPPDWLAPVDYQRQGFRGYDEYIEWPDPDTQGAASEVVPLTSAKQKKGLQRRSL